MVFKSIYAKKNLPCRDSQKATEKFFFRKQIALFSIID